MEGASNSPLELGTLQLDRTPPTASSLSLTPEGGAVTASWDQGDALSGTDPSAPLIAEVNASPTGDTTGAWVPFAEQPPGGGDGFRSARTNLGGLVDGRHVVRVRSRDRAGNAGAVVLGTVLSDGTPPRVFDVGLARPLTSPTALAEILFQADDAAGAGVSGGRPRVAPIGSSDDVDWAVPGASGPGHVLVRTPGPGVFVVTVRVTDRVGNRGESVPVTIRVPTPAEAADASVGPTPGDGVGTGAAPGPGVAWAYAQTRRFHRQRGVRLSAAVGVARDAAEWRRLLGVGSAARYSGYSTLRGRILLGPAATRGVEGLGRIRSRGVAGRIPRADLDGAVLGLAVLLHESLHETGPVDRTDALGTRSGRAFEEGVTEAATLDLLRGLVASLDVPAALRARLLAAVGRYRRAYGVEVAWVRRASARATRSSAGSARARAWRIRVADTWGADRWPRLAAATGRGESELRAEAAGLGGAGPQR